MSKPDNYQKELAKLQTIFADCEPGKKQLVEGLIEDAAFLYAENVEIRARMAVTGMVKVHPQHPELQKSTEDAKQYLKNVNSYSVIIKALNGILSKTDDADDAELEDYS